MNQLSGGAERLVLGLLVEARNALELSKKYHGQGMVYAAASRAFLAAILAGQAYDVTVALMGGRDTALKLIEQRIVDASKILEEAQSTYNGVAGESPTITRLQLLVVARERILSANEALERVRVLRASGNLLDALQEAVYAYYRALTAKSWAETAADPNAAQGVAIDSSLLRELAYTIYYIASTSVSYADSLGAPTAGLNNLLEEADRLIAENDYIGSLSASVSALISATTILHASFETPAEPRLNAVREHVLSQMRLVAEKGYQPILPSLYIEYADALRGEEKPDQALGMYIAAAMYTLLLYGLVEKGSPVPPGTQLLPVTVTKSVTETVTTTEAMVKTVSTIVEKTVTEREIVTVASPVTMYKPMPATVDQLLKIAIVGLAVGLAVGVVLAYAVSRRS